MRKRLSVAAGTLCGAALLLWFSLGMNRGTLLSNDIKALLPPWAPFYPERPLGAVVSDPVFQFVPWLEFARGELAAGRLPLWNPHQDGGVPLLGNMQSALGSPLLWPALVLGVEPGWNLSLLFRILLALAGAYAWLRDLGRSKLASAVGAVAFALSGPFVAWLEHPHTSTAAAIPLLLFYAGRAARGGGARNLFGLAIATYLVLAGGHPETQLLAALLTTAVVLFEARRPSRALAPAAGALLGAGLAAPLLFPFLEYFAASQARYGIERASFTMPWTDLRAFVVHRLPGANLLESAATVSIPVLLLVPFGVASARRDRRALFSTLAAIACLLVTYENPLSHFLATHTRIYWTRALLLLPLPLGYLAAAGIDSLRDRLGPGRRAALATAGSAAVFLAVSAELLVAARGFHMITRVRQRSVVTPLLARLEKDRDVFRVVGLHTFLAPNTATDYRLDDVRGYDALAPRGWRRRRAEMGRFGDGRFQKDILEPWDLAPGGRALDFWNVKYLLLDPRLAFGDETLNEKRGLDLEPFYSGPDGRILKNRRVLPRARIEGGAGTVEILERFPARWRLEADVERAGTLLIANPVFPGWKARVDGRAVAIDEAPGEPITLPLSPGRHRVEVFYSPASLRLGLVVAVAAAIVLAAVWRRGRGAAGLDSPTLRT